MEFQSKTTMKYHYTPTRMIKKKKKNLATLNAGEEVEL